MGYSGARGNVHRAAVNLANNMTGDLAPSPDQADLMGTPQDDPSTAIGIEQAIGDIPELQKRLRKQFEEESGGNLDETQQMILENLQIAQEYLTNPEMADVYRKLGEVPRGSQTSLGLHARPGESPSITQRRDPLLAQRDQLRAGPPKKKHRSPLQWLKDLFSRKKS